jgi:hypothetical protein
MTEIEALLSEADVLKRWPALSKSKLLAARKDKRIGWVRGKRGAAWYRPSAIEIFITQELEQPCRDHAHETFLNSAANGSPRNPADPATTASGMTQELAERAGQASAKRILSGQKRSSPKSSSKVLPNS